MVDRVLGPVLAQGSTATGSLTRRVNPEKLTWPGKIGMTTSTIITKNGKACMSIPPVRLSAARVTRQPEVTMVKKLDVKVLKNSVSYY